MAAGFVRFEWKIYWFIGAAEAMSILSTVITSPPDRKNCVFEIWAGGSQFAEVSHEPGKPIEIKIYPPVEGGKWDFRLEDLMAALHQATKTLACHE